MFVIVVVVLVVINCCFNRDNIFICLLCVCIYFGLHFTGQEAEAEVVFDGPEDNRQETNFIARINYRLLLLLVLLGVTALAVAIAMTVLVTVTLHRKRHKMRLISENKLQEVMKKTGYVNPAYTFYTHC